MLPLSAQSPEALRALSTMYAEMLAAPGAPAAAAVCAAAALRRTALEQRAAFVATSTEALIDALRSHAGGAPASAEGVALLGESPKVAFVVPGQGGQWVGMGRELMLREPAFRAALERCDAAMRPYAAWSILEQLEIDPSDPGYAGDRIDVIQPLLVALAVAYAEWLGTLGVRPDAVVGHSLGEVAAACIAGVLSLDACMRIICLRSALMRRTSGAGAMALVELPMAELQRRLTAREAAVSVAVSNSPRSSVISGDPAVVHELLAAFERDGIFCRAIKVDVASHSPQMQPLVAELVQGASCATPVAGTVPIYSTVLGRVAGGAEFDATYWGRNLREPVRFTDAVAALVNDGVSVFMELGPHPVLTAAVQQNAQALGHERIVAVACGHREQPEQVAALSAVATLWASGRTIEWRILSRIRTGTAPDASIVLPTYPWQRERHWLAAAELAPASPAHPRSQRDRSAGLGESSQWLYRQHWALIAPPQATGSAHEGRARVWHIVSDDPDAARALLDAAPAAARVSGVGTLDELLQALRTATPSADDAPLDLLVLCGDAAAGAYLPLQVLQAALPLVTNRRARLWFITRGAQQVPAAADARVFVTLAALWGAARVVAEEHPDLWGGLVDLHADASIASVAATLWTHLLCDDGEDQVALRPEGRFALRLARFDAASRIASPPAPAWRPDATYVVTGGLGDIALRVVRSLVDLGARRFLLLGRTALPPREEWTALDPVSAAGRRTAAIRAIEAAGATVHVAAVDVCEEPAMRKVLAEFVACGWPPIRGVIHAVGGFANQLASAMGRGAFDAVVEPKLRGAQILDRLLTDLDLFVLFSSIGAFMVQPGQANYAAANAGLDAFALERRARGLPAQSIAWGVWEGTGLVSDEAGARNVEEMHRRGIESFDAARGTSMFAWLRDANQPYVAVLPVNWGPLLRGARPTE